MLVYIIYSLEELSILMSLYVKRVQSEQADKGKYYHWHSKCPEYPQRGKETILIFKKRPTHLPPCPKCSQLDNKKN
jgi:hypothetical protein